MNPGKGENLCNKMAGLVGTGPLAHIILFSVMTMIRYYSALVLDVFLYLVCVGRIEMKVLVDFASQHGHLIL